MVGRYAGSVDGLNSFSSMTDNLQLLLKPGINEKIQTEFQSAPNPSLESIAFLPSSSKNWEMNSRPNSLIETYFFLTHDSRIHEDIIRGFSIGRISVESHSFLLHIPTIPTVLQDFARV